MQSTTTGTTSSALPLVPKTHTEKLGDLDAILRRVKQALPLRGVQSITITPKELTVVRLMEDPTAEVLDPPPAFSLEAVMVDVELMSLELAGHPLLVLNTVMEIITSKELRVVGAIAHAPTLAAYLGYDEGELPSSLLGHPVIYSDDQEYEASIVILGAHSPFLADAVFGVIIDPFMEEV